MLEGKIAAIYTVLWAMNPETACLYASPVEVRNGMTAMFMTHLDGHAPGSYVAIWVRRDPVPVDSIRISTVRRLRN